MMNKDVVDFPNRSTIDEEAAGWLIRLDCDQRPSAEEKAELGAWLGRSTVHRESIIELARLWDRMNVLTELAVPLGEVPKAKRHGGMTGRRWAVASFAVAVTLVASVAWLARDVWWGNPMADTNGLYATAVGQQQETVLADGSVVQLNTNSQVAVNYSDTVRDVRLLQGEAYFTVTDNADVPFRVQAGDSLVEAVGTAFAVQLSEHGVDVTVAEGSVRLSRANVASPSLNGSAAAIESTATTIPDRRLDLGTLEVGQRGVIGLTDSEPTAALSVDVVDLGQQLAWREGVLMFSGEPLDKAVREISRYTTLRIDIADPAIQQMPVGGRFPIGEIDTMLHALELNFGLDISRPTPDRVVINAATN